MKTKISEVILGDHTFLYQLVRFGQRLVHIRHVEMSYIGAEHRIQASLQRMLGAIECIADRMVLALASEVKLRHEQVADVCFVVNLTTLELVKAAADLMGSRDQIRRIDSFLYSRET